jgi:lysophospholipase L1-like esterase
VVRQGMTYEELKRQYVVFPYYAGTYSVDKFLSLHRSYNNAIRRVASKYGVPLVDLDTIFNKYDKDDLFWDTMHPSTKGHRLIARSLADKIQEIVENNGMEG